MKQIFSRSQNEASFVQGGLKWGVVFALVLSCASLLALNLVDPDLWGHVRYGQDWLEEGELPRTATHTYTAEGYPWINHENLAELTFALGTEHLGVNGMLIAKCLWGLGILMTMVWVARRYQVNLILVWVFMLLVATNLQAFFPLRPQLLSFGLCTAMLLLLDRAFCRWEDNQKVDWRWFVLLPPLFAVWVNSHGGFVLGLCIAGAFIGGRIIDLIRIKPQHHLPQISALAVLGICCLVATLCNPYGLGMHRWLLDSLSAARPEISEWGAPKLSQPVFWPWILMIVTTVLSFGYSRLRRDWVQIAILLIVAWQSAMHLRHISFLTLLCGFWVTPHLQSALDRLRATKSSDATTFDLSSWMKGIAALLLAIAIGVQGFALQDRLSSFPVERNYYPVDALQYMAEHDLNGKLVVCFNWAQYAIAALAPDTQVGFDGRFRTCYPQEVIDMHFDFLLGDLEDRRNRSPESGPIDGTKLLDYESPDLVLLDTRYENATAIMRHEASQPYARWTMLYSDGVAEIWGRTDRYDNPTSCHYFPLASRAIDLEPPVGHTQWPALPIKETNSIPTKEDIVSHDQGYDDDSI